MPVVGMPDGTQVQFPDTMPADQIRTLILNKFPNAGSGIPDSGPSIGADTGLQPGGKSPMAVPTPAPPTKTTDLSKLPLSTSIPLQMQTFTNNAVESLPVVGGLLKRVGQWGGQQVSGVSPEQAQAGEDRLNNAYPVARTAGQVAGTVAPFIAGAEIPAVAGALGMDAGAGLGAQVGMGMLSQGAIGAADAFTRDANVGQIAEAGGLGAIGGLAGPLIGKGVGAVAGNLVGRGTAAEQKAAVDAAVAQAPDLDTMRKTASALFQNSVDTNPPMIKPGSYQNLLDSIEQATAKSRPTVGNNPEAVGMFEKLQGLADEINDPTKNTVIDLKNLHMLRMDANEVANSAAKPSTQRMGAIMVNKIDDFVKGLNSNDILGATDPTQASKDLMSGISNWARVSRAQMVTDAISKADGYASGPTNGLRLAFLDLTKQPEFANFTPIEQNAIRQVATGGVPTQKALSLLGRMGFSLGGGGAHNIAGGTIGAIAGAGAGTAALTPVLGPFAPVAGAALEAFVTHFARGAAQKMALKGAQRAAALTRSATPVAEIPRAVSSAPDLATQLARIGSQGATMAGSEALTGQPTAPNPYPVPQGISAAPAR